MAPPAGPRVDGVTLRPLLEQADAAGWPDRTLFTHNPIDESNKYPGAVRTQRYRLVREIKGSGGGSKARMAAAQKVVNDFSIATECGFGRLT